MSHAPVAPSTNATAFSCPHCGAYTSQHWFKVFAEGISSDERKPAIPDFETREGIAADRQIDAQIRHHLLEWVDRMLTGLVHLHELEKGVYVRLEAENLNI